MNETTITKVDNTNENSSLKRVLVALIRMQALWMFYYAFYYALGYLPVSFRNFHQAMPDSSYYLEAKFSLLMEIFRIILHIAVGILILQYTKPLLDYLLKDAEVDAEEEK